MYTECNLGLIYIAGIENYEDEVGRLDENLCCDGWCVSGFDGGV